MHLLFVNMFCVCVCVAHFHQFDPALGGTCCKHLGAKERPTSATLLPQFPSTQKTLFAGLTVLRFPNAHIVMNILRFKAIGYSAMPKHDNKEGLVCLLFKKKTEEVEAGKAGIISGISQMMGNKPNLRVEVLSVKSLGGNSGTTELVLTVTEQQQGGNTRKVPASDLHAFLNGQAAQLKGAGVEMVVPKLSFTKADIATYLDSPPAGIDARLWKQAQADNPDPSKLLPVPMVGFKALQERTAAQEAQAKAHGGRLDTISTDLAELQKKAADTLAALTEAKRRQLELSHRVLKVLVKQESTRKVGFTITQQEEVIRGQLENLQVQITLEMHKRPSQALLVEEFALPMNDEIVSG